MEEVVHRGHRQRCTREEHRREEVSFLWTETWASGRMGDIAVRTLLYIPRKILELASGLDKARNLKENQGARKKQEHVGLAMSHKYFLSVSVVIGHRMPGKRAGLPGLGFLQKCVHLHLGLIVPNIWPSIPEKMSTKDASIG